jgi:hypothetical protein
VSKQLANESLYPDEASLWDKRALSYSTNLSILPLPKLKTQFLTMFDYLERQFELYRLEYEGIVRKVCLLHEANFSLVSNRK